MDFWFQMGITILKGVLASLHVDLSKKALLQSVLLGVANDIYVLYDMTPPTAPAAS
jgi:hypothetical protein